MMDRLSFPVAFLFHCVVTTTSLRLLFTSSAITCTSFLLVDAAAVRKPPPIPPNLGTDHAHLLNSLTESAEWPVSIRDLNHAIRHGTDYLLRHCNDEGKFTYQADTVDADRFADSVKYNMLRHSGAIFALSQAYARRPNKSIPPAMERAVQFLKSEAMGPLKKSDTKSSEQMWAVWSSEKVSGQKNQPPTAKLGGAGLALVALTAMERIKKHSTPLEVLQALGRFVLFMQNDDGGFVSKFIPSEGGKDTSFVSLYYPGEASLGLLSLYELDPDPKWLASAAKAIKYLYTLRKNSDLDDIEPDHWALIATSKLMVHIGDGDHPDCTRKQALDHAVKVCKSMVLTPDELLETGGCLVNDHRTCPTSTRIEGYSAALTFLPNVTMTEKMLVRLVEYNMDAGVRYLLRSQRVAGDVEDNMLGSFPGIYPPEERRRDGSTEVRIDYVQHALSGLIGYERERFHQGKVRISMLRRVAEAIGWGLRRLILTVLSFVLVIGVMLWARPKSSKMH